LNMKQTWSSRGRDRRGVARAGGVTNAVAGWSGRCGEAGVKPQVQGGRRWKWGGRHRFSVGLGKEGAGLDRVKGHEKREVVLGFHFPFPRPLETQDRIHRSCRPCQGLQCQCTCEQAERVRAMSHVLEWLGSATAPINLTLSSQQSTQSLACQCQSRALDALDTAQPGTRARGSAQLHTLTVTQRRCGEARDRQARARTKGHSLEEALLGLGENVGEHLPRRGRSELTGGRGGGG
jgi:hypothetical protein